MAMPDLSDSANARHHDARAIPDLPPEIVYEILVMAYHEDPKSCTNLLLIAKYISDWLIPLVYEVIIVDAEHPPLKALQRHGHHVKHLALSDQSDDVTILEGCLNVSDLVLWDGLRLTPPIGVFDLSLRRFAFHTISDKFEHEIRNLQKMDNEKYQRWCSNMTHIAWGTIPPSICELLPSFHNLTHFLLGDWNEWQTHPQDIVNRVFKSCPRMEVVVVLLGEVRSESEILLLDSLDDFVFDDVRVVVVDAYFMLSWTQGARGEDDLWAIAERSFADV